MYRSWWCPARRDLYVERALRAGTWIYHETRTTDIMMYAIRRVLRGEIYVSDKMIRSSWGDSSQAILPIPSVNSRTAEQSRTGSISLIGEGIHTAPLRQGLHVSIKTVESIGPHQRETPLNDTTELVRYAMTMGDSARSARPRTMSLSALTFCDLLRAFFPRP